MSITIPIIGLVFLGRAGYVARRASVTDSRMVTEAIASGANDYIAKPFQVSLLIERVERYIHGR